jgi:hypothetical protein
LDRHALDGTRVGPLAHWLAPISGYSFFSFSLTTSSASTSFVSRRTGPGDFVRFDVGSLFFPELLSFFKVDLLSRFDCTLECVDQR